MRVPKTIVWAAIIAVPSLIGGGAWYLADQQADAKHLFSEFTASRLEAVATKTAIETRQKEEEEAERQIDLRLTRIEAQLAFLVNTTSPSVGEQRKP